jgi:TatD family-associated radical SAM protein
MGDLVYEIGRRLYVNLTNRCVNDCVFCLRRAGPGVAGASLWLASEPSAAEYVAAVRERDPNRFDEVVFCGYGEPLLRADVLAEVARFIRANSKTPLRVDTNGLGSLALRRDVLPDLVGLVDTFSISLNAQDGALYDSLCRPAFGPRAYPALLAFAREAVRLFPRVILTVVGVPGVDLDDCARIASELGAEFRVREYIDSGQRDLAEVGPRSVADPGRGDSAGGPSPPAKSGE